MKAYYLLIISIVVITACTKPGDGDNGDSNTPPAIDYTPLPVSSPIHTNISAFVELNRQTNNPVYLLINNATAYNVAGNYTSATNVSADLFQNNIDVVNSLTATTYFDNTRSFPLTSSSRNYVDVNNVRKEYLGSLTYSLQGGTWPLPAGGKITFTPYSFGNYGGPSNGISAYFAILDPTSHAFSITNPSFTADADQKRWFLHSYGIIKFSTAYPIAAVSDVRLEFPIPELFWTTAPDSLEAWYYSDHQWVARGHAIRSGNYYTKKLDQAGMWNFGVRSKGLYKTIKVRTDKNVPVTNAILCVKRGTLEVGSARTDVNGDAICFLPVQDSLSIDIRHHWDDTTSPIPFTIKARTYRANEDITISLPASSYWVTTVKGSARLCNGGVVEKGTVTVTHPSGLINYYIPVSNGKYGAAFIRRWDREIFNLKVRTEPGGLEGSDTAVLLQKSIDNVVDLSTCKVATNLFMNYSIDGIPYSITGDGSQPFNPALVGYSGSTTLVSCADKTTGKGLQFETSANSPGLYSTNHVTDLVVNGTRYVDDINTPTIVNFTSYDLLPGGYITGSLNMYFKDNLGGLHELVANFRLKRII